MLDRLNEPAAREVLALDVPARLGTLDPDGHPRITPIWFLWDGSQRTRTGTLTLAPPL